MNTKCVNVYDSPYIVTNIIDKVAITVMSIELFTSVTITASLFDKKNY
jgi:hypothetical protein